MASAIGNAEESAAIEANIKALEGLLDEFFRDVPNERKAEIERLLNEFGEQRSSWRDSLVFLNRSNNPYVSMFSLTTIENTIRKRWVGMDGNEKTEIRTQLHTYLVKHHASVPAYIRNKVIKLLVDIATTDWPHFYPTFFTDITSWIHGDVTGGSSNANGRNVVVGLSFLLITSEELATPRDNVTSARKEELKRLLATQVPQVMSSLSSLLESLLPLFRGGATSRLASTTPPPSPSPSDSLDHDEDSSSGDSSSHGGSISVQAGSMSSGIGGSRRSLLTSGHRGGVGTSSLLHVAKDLLNQEVSAIGLHGNIAAESAVEVTTLALKCLAHLFTWVPLTTVISPRLLASIFHFAGLAIPENGNVCSSTTGTDHRAYNSYTSNQLSILAMGTINEVIYRHCVPVDFEDFLLQMFQNTFQLLQMLVQPINTVQGTPPMAGVITYQLQTLDDSYVEKFTEFIHSFVQSHLRRFENSLQFPIHDFLALLYKYTFAQPRPDGYMACLDIWCTFVDFVSGTLASTRSVEDCATVLTRYREAFSALVVEVLKKLQFRCNSTALEEMDDETIDDDQETEWQHYLRASIETVLRISDVLPEDVLRIVEASWKETSVIYLQLEKYIQQNCKRFSMTTANSSGHSDEVEFTRLHHLLRDFASLIQIMGRLSVLFTGGNIHEPGFGDHLRQGLDTVRHLIELASFGSRAKLYSLEGHIPEVLISDFTQAHAQTLAALKAWCHWLSQLHKLSLQDKAYEIECKELIAHIMMAVSPVLKDQGVGKNRSLLVHSASHFLVTLTGSVRPPSIWKLKEFTELYSSLPHLVLSDSEDHRLMVRALSNVLLLPWPGIAEQRWDERQNYLTKFLHDLTGTLRNVRNMPDFTTNKSAREQAKPGILHTLRLIKDLCDNVREEGNATKKLCHDCIREYIQIVLWLLPIYVYNNSSKSANALVSNQSGSNISSQEGQFDVEDRQMCEEAFSFFRTVLDVLKSQMGADSVNQVVHTVLTLFNRDQLTESVMHEGSAGIKVIEKLLEILQLVVKETDGAFRRFIDSSLTLCLDQIYPLIAEKPTSDIKGPLYLVLYHVLLYNWRHFFKSSAVKKLMEGSLEESPGADTGLQEQARFLSILHAFGQSFLQPDISVFKQNLAALEDINAKWKLYHKSVFTQHLIVQFLTVLLQVLVNNSHNLLKDEITSALYNMASVDFNVFFNEFLLQFLDSQELDSNQKQMLRTSFKTDTDMPTFNSNMNRFIGDLRYYKTCNASLPIGSVKFAA